MIRFLVKPENGKLSFRSLMGTSLIDAPMVLRSEPSVWVKFTVDFQSENLIGSVISLNQLVVDEH